MAPPSKVWLFSRVIDTTGARQSASSSAESNTLGAPFAAVHGRTQDQMEFVDKPRAQKGSVGSASSFQQETFHAEFAIEDVQSEREVKIRVPGKDIGDFFAT